MYLDYFTFLTRLFCLQGDLEKTAQVEGCVIDCLIAMVMKLSEVTFRPLFFKVTPPCLGFSRRPSFPPCGDNCICASVPQLFDWSKSERKDRLLTFYRLSDRIADRLKGLFVLFAGNLVKPFADLLTQTNSTGLTSSTTFLFL